MVGASGPLRNRSSIAEQIVHGGQIEVELAGPLGLELSRLQFDDEVTVQPEMIEEEINVEGLTPDLKRHLAADKGESSTKLQEKVAKIFEETTFKLPLFGGRAQGQELERIWILKELPREVGVRCRQRSVKVRQRLPLPIPQLRGDVVGQHVSAPTILEGGAQIPLPALRVLEPIEQNHMMTPRQFCSKLQNLRVRPRLGKRPHVAKIAQAEALYPRKLVTKILGQPIHYLGSPALGRKAGGEVLSDRPVEPDGLLVEGQGSAQLSGPNPGLQLFEQGWVARGEPA